MYKGGQVGSTMYKGMPPPDPPCMADTKAGGGGRQKDKKKRSKRIKRKSFFFFAFNYADRKKIGRRTTFYEYV